MPCIGKQAVRFDMGTSPGRDPPGWLLPVWLRNIATPGHTMPLAPPAESGNGKLPKITLRSALVVGGSGHEPLPRPVAEPCPHRVGGPT